MLWEADGIRASGPNGFPVGGTQSNLLTIDPTPRNPRLADAQKRIGLAERSGLDADRTFEDLLRFGRVVPDYGSSTATSVAVKLFGGQDFDQSHSLHASQAVLGLKVERHSEFPRNRPDNLNPESPLQA